MRGEGWRNDGKRECDEEVKERESRNRISRKERVWKIKGHCK